MIIVIILFNVLSSCKAKKPHSVIDLYPAQRPACSGEGERRADGAGGKKEREEEGRVKMVAGGWEGRAIKTKQKTNKTLKKTTKNISLVN